MLTDDYHILHGDFYRLIVRIDSCRGYERLTHIKIRSVCIFPAFELIARHLSIEAIKVFFTERLAGRYLKSFKRIIIEAYHIDCDLVHRIACIDGNCSLFEINIIDIYSITVRIYPTIKMISSI